MPEGGNGEKGDCCPIVLAILLPPLGVGVKLGCGVCTSIHHLLIISTVSKCNAGFLSFIHEP
jgi:uncharacterized membrane protein YqaE (UPF0057 family)